MSEKEMNKIFARNLKGILKSKNVSQVELANRLNVSKSTISNWISGLAMPRMETVNAICDILDVDILLLIDDGNLFLSSNTEDYKARKHFYTLDNLRKALEMNLKFNSELIGWAFENENFSNSELLDIINYAEFVKNRRK